EERILSIVFAAKLLGVKILLMIQMLFTDISNPIVLVLEIMFSQREQQGMEQSNQI
ncbi:baculoviral IAP repeat-containing protein 3, partial [Biomphalaria pfeifferi]